MIDGCKMYVFKMFADISRTCDNTVLGNRIVLGNRPKFTLSKEVSEAIFRDFSVPTCQPAAETDPRTRRRRTVLPKPAGGSPCSRRSGLPCRGWQSTPAPRKTRAPPNMTEKNYYGFDSRFQYFNEK